MDGCTAYCGYGYVLLKCEGLGEGGWMHSILWPWICSAEVAGGGVGGGRREKCLYEKWNTTTNN